MFGNRFFNKIVKSDGNLQVSGNVGNIEIGIKPEDHFRALEARASEIRKDQEEIRRLSEDSLRFNVATAEIRIAEQQAQIDKLTEILNDPQKYIDYASDACTKISELLNDLQSNNIVENLDEIRREIRSGSLHRAGKLLEEIESLPSINLKLKAETVCVRATLAFLDLQFDKAEALSRQAFYLEPSISGLVNMLDQLDMNGERGKLVAAFNEAKATLTNCDARAHVRLKAIEAWSRAISGDMAGAKAAIKAGDKANRKLSQSDNEAVTQIILCKASMAVVEGDYAQALKHFKIALKKLEEEEKEENNVVIIRIEANIGASLAELGRLKEAITITRACVERLRLEGDAVKYHLGIRLNNLGDFLTRDGKAEEALDTLREAIQLAIQFLPRRHPSLMKRRLNLAIALKQLGRPDEAVRELMSIEVDEAALNELDKRSFVQSKSVLFDYFVKHRKWFEALSAALDIEKIGAEYLGDAQAVAALPYAISEIRTAILTGDYIPLEKFTGIPRRTQRILE